VDCEDEASMAEDVKYLRPQQEKHELRWVRSQDRSDGRLVQ
jgi:hypothetical protein